jgi:hypothetical protein
MQTSSAQNAAKALRIARRMAERFTAALFPFATTNGSPSRVPWRNPG